MEFILESIRSDWQLFLAFIPRLFYGAVLFAVFWIGGRMLANVLGRVLQRGGKPQASMVFAQRLVMWILRIAGSLMVLGVLGFKGVAASLLATGGVLAIVIGFAFKEIGENLLAGIFLVFSRPFECGDLVKSGGLTGTVQSIDIRSVHLRTADACDVFVPNAQIFSQDLYNYTRDGLRRPDFTIGVAYQDEPEKVISLLEDATRGINGVLAEPRAFVSIKTFADSYIEYQVFFYLDTFHGKLDIVELTNDVMVSCWRALSEAGMTFSTDVTTGLDIRSAPAFHVEGLQLPAE